MSFKADFSVAGKTYRVLKCTYAVHQDVDATGRPSSEVRGGQIEVEVEATSDTSLANWAIAMYKVEDGKITFYRRDNEQKMLELSFKQGYCVDYKAEFDFIGEIPMIEKIRISAQEINIGSVGFSNEWPE
ncbi:MAG TPA: type VI secretion system tube protein TssD [Chitinophagales bacterium]|nr:type VI secretion system tube protein TssD [Chitinophagales bacterium]